jgi:Na+:H+ antiporter, NhaA family
MSGIVLLAAAAAALAWANSPWRHSYETLWHLMIDIGLGRLLAPHDLHFWVDDGLMTVFFLVVGLEIRREMFEGALTDPRVATLPFVAALGGVLVPALLYLLINPHPASHHGWAIPTATDIAFAVGVLSLSAGVSPALRMLLLTVAIIDDIVAIIVIAVFYSNGIDFGGLALAAAGVLLALGLQRVGVAAALPYVLPGAVVWFGMLRAGVHPSLAGVVLGLMTPATAVFGRSRRASVGGSARSPLLGLEARLHPYVSFGILPLFALANAGVDLQGVDFSAATPLSIGAGVIAGLLLGKPLGIVLAARIAVRLKLCALPEGVLWSHVTALGVLGGIGFTMSIFIAKLAFLDGGLLAAAKCGVLIASCLAATCGLILGRRLSGRRGG